MSLPHIDRCCIEPWTGNDIECAKSIGLNTNFHHLLPWRPLDLICLAIRQNKTYPKLTKFTSRSNSLPYKHHERKNPAVLNPTTAHNSINNAYASHYMPTWTRWNVQQFKYFPNISVLFHTHSPTLSSQPCVPLHLNQAQHLPLYRHFLSCFLNFDYISIWDFYSL